ncbi:unnamed protein product [Cercospora beticola]|nr:unnamed protein product [Cercospora beticola]
MSKAIVRRCLKLLATIVNTSQTCDVILEIKSKFNDVEDLINNAAGNGYAATDLVTL